MDPQPLIDSMSLLIYVLAGVIPSLMIVDVVKDWIRNDKERKAE